MNEQFNKICAVHRQTYEFKILQVFGVFHIDSHYSTYQSNVALKRCSTGIDPVKS